MAALTLPHPRLEPPLAFLVLCSLSISLSMVILIHVDEFRNYRLLVFPFNMPILMSSRNPLGLALSRAETPLIISADRIRLDGWLRLPNIARANKSKYVLKAQIGI